VIALDLRWARGLHARTRRPGLGVQSSAGAVLSHGVQPPATGRPLPPGAGLERSVARR